MTDLEQLARETVEKWHTYLYLAALRQAVEKFNYKELAEREALLKETVEYLVRFMSPSALVDNVLARYEALSKGEPSDTTTHETAT